MKRRKAGAMLRTQHDGPASCSIIGNESRRSNVSAYGPRNAAYENAVRDPVEMPTLQGWAVVRRLLDARRKPLAR